MPRRIVWCVSSSRSTTSAGSSSTQPVQGVGQLVLVGLRCGRRRPRPAPARAGRGRAPRTGVPFGASVSPVAVPDSLATAAMSPATTAARSRCSLPAEGEQPVQALVGAGARVDEVVVGLDRARQHLEQRDLADVAVGDGLEHEGQRLRRRGPGRSRPSVPPASTSTGGRSSGRRADLADEVGQPVDGDAGRSPSRTPPGTRSRRRRRGPACARAARATGTSPSRKRSSRSSSATTMPSTRLSCTWCSSASMSSGIGPELCSAWPVAAVVGEGGVGQQVGDAAEVGLLADRQLERGDAGAERGRAAASSVRSNDGPLPVELVDEDHAGQAELGGRLPQLARSAPRRRRPRSPRTRPGRRRACAASASPSKSA